MQNTTVSGHKTLRLVLDPTSINEPLTLEIVFRRGGGQQQLPFSSDCDTATAVPVKKRKRPVSLSSEQRKVIEVLRQTQQSLTARQIVEIGGISKNFEATRRMIQRLADRGLIARDGHARYVAVPQQTTI